MWQNVGLRRADLWSAKRRLSRGEARLSERNLRARKIEASISSMEAHISTSLGSEAGPRTETRPLSGARPYIGAPGECDMQELFKRPSASTGDTVRPRIGATALLVEDRPQSGGGDTVSRTDVTSRVPQ